MIRAEWVKFRTVRGWVIAVVIAVAAIIAFGLGPSGQGSCNQSSCGQTLGPGGEAVSDSFYFVHKQLAAAGAITVRVTSLTSAVPSPSGAGLHRVQVPWAKAGLIIKASLRPGSAYAAMMVTSGNGVRMQYDYTGDIAAPAISAAQTKASQSPASPAQAHWLRLVRSGSTVTGYESADGVRWIRVASVLLPGLPSTVPGGLFVTSPQYSQTSLGVSSISGSPSQSTATFDHLALSGPAPARTSPARTSSARTSSARTSSGWASSGWASSGWASSARASSAWTGTDLGAGGGAAAGPATSYQRTGGQFTVTGSGDIAPAVAGAAGIGDTIAQTLLGVFVALILLAVVAAMFVTAEYRRGLIRVTFAASPRRDRVLAAKAIVIAAVTFTAGLAGAAVAVIFGQQTLRGHGDYIWPVSPLTELRVIAGTAAAIAVCAVIAVAIGAVLRRGAAAVSVVVTLIVLPYLLAVAIPVLPLSVADWLMRVTPAAAFAVEQTVIQYPQVSNVYAPAYGYFPLAPWAGFCVLCAWALAALALATYLLRRRDA